MKIFNKIQNIDDGFRKYFTLGSFDGLHIGHKKIIETIVQEAYKNNGKTVVLSFINHPLSIINPERVPKQILTNKEKQEKLENLGVDYYINLSFTYGFSLLTAQKFMQKLQKKLDIAKVVVGYDCSFGKDQKGSVQLLKDNGFDVKLIETVKIGDSIISSTNIRKLVEKGELELANKMLGDYYSLSGKIVYGTQRGQKIGYPTINILYENEKLIPALGVYIAKVGIDDKTYEALVNFGFSPTFNENKLRLEAYIFAFAKNVYGRKAKIQLLKYLRGEKIFFSVNKLKVQMDLDCQEAKNYFKNL